jgi:hypothetical protein
MSKHSWSMGCDNPEKIKDKCNVCPYVEDTGKSNPPQCYESQAVEYLKSIFQPVGEGK